ncbi:MAG: DNA-protecting protein DprA [Deltaproteobacteria bacterium]|nr:DNA-protecting protein DprA [Deltaproteobacteria bacterium]
MGTSRHARYWLTLRSLEGLGDVACRKLFEAFGSPAEVFRAPRERLARAGLPAAAIARIVGSPRRDEADAEVARAAALGVDLVCLGDERYPTGLRFIHDPPPVLYVRGGLEPGDVEAVAVVGSRSASAYGVAVAERLARELAASGVTVVSGLALGIDGAAHRGALAGGGRTLAVLGCGIDRVYPRRHGRLAEQVAAGGALVSELPIGTPPDARNFPRRNRLVAGLSLGVVVVEASEKSGSLITARLALEQGREVLAVPGEAGLERTRGTHRLIRQGARLVESGAEVIADVLPWRTPPPPRAPVPAVSEEQGRVLAAFAATVEHVDRLIERSRLAPGRVLETLLQLELAGWVRRHAGMLFSREKSPPPGSPSQSSGRGTPSTPASG